MSIDSLFSPVTRSAQPRIDALTDDITVHAVADITEHAAALWAALHPRPDIPDALFDALLRIAAWGMDYAKSPEVTHRHFIQDAVGDLNPWRRLCGYEALINRAVSVHVAVQTAVRSAM